MSLHEARMWAAVFDRSAPARRPHEDDEHYEWRVRDRYRFTTRLSRGPSGCWVWSGSMTNPGPRCKTTVKYPIFYRKRIGVPRSQINQSAFSWMMIEWFPGHYLAKVGVTVVTCGNQSCLNPGHREMKFPHKKKAKLSPDDALAIHELKGVKSATSVAVMFKVPRDVVFRIWNGWTWSSVTGEPNKNLLRRQNA